MADSRSQRACGYAVTPTRRFAVMPRSRSEKNLFRDRISHPGTGRYSSDVDQIVQRKRTNHDVGIGSRYSVGIDVIVDLSSLIHKIVVHAESSVGESQRSNHPIPPFEPIISSFPSIRPPT